MSERFSPNSVLTFKYEDLPLTCKIEIPIYFLIIFLYFKQKMDVIPLLLVLVIKSVLVLIYFNTKNIQDYNNLQKTCPKYHSLNHKIMTFHNHNPLIILRLVNLLTFLPLHKMHSLYLELLNLIFLINLKIKPKVSPQKARM